MENKKFANLKIVKTIHISKVNTKRLIAVKVNFFVDNENVYIVA